jgi:phage tail-like protein
MVWRRRVDKGRRWSEEPVVPTDRGRRTAAGEPSSTARFAVHVDGEEIAVAWVSAPTLAADRGSVTARPVPRDPDRVVWTGKPERGTVVLARAVDGDRTFYEWRRAALSSGREVHVAATRDVEVAVLDAAGLKPVFTYRLVSAWPLRWSGPALDALQPSVAVEELELIYHDLHLV